DARILVRPIQKPFDANRATGIDSFSVGRGGRLVATTRLRVLHVIPSVAPRDGGPSAAIAPMCRALAECGVEPFIVATDADGSGRLPLPIGEPSEWNGIPAVFFRRDLSTSLKYSRGVSRWLRDNVANFDVVHVHALMSHASLAAATASRRSDVPYIIRPLGTIAPWSLSQKRFRKRA